MRVVCAWCTKLLEPGTGPTSHGICPGCAALEQPTSVDPPRLTRSLVEDGGADVGCSSAALTPAAHPALPPRAALDSLQAFVLQRIGEPDANGCRPWTGHVDRDKGYGRVEHAALNTRRVYAHRLVYEMFVGPIPEGLQLDHLCRNRACVNTDHLEPVTNRENGLRGESFAAENARKTHCPHGHEYTPENTYAPPSYLERRDCLTCKTARNRARDRSRNQTAALPSALVALARARRAWEQSSPQLFMEV